MSVTESVENRTAWEQLSNAPELVPETMHAAVYVGGGNVEVRSIPTPRVGLNEVLIRVESCGICHTDLKKIEQNLLAPPRVFGHETAGVIAAAGENVTKFAVGDRVIVFHHVPCSQCFYCERRLYAQCPGYKRVGVTAGYEAAGGGFAQYVRVLDWVVERGIELIPDGVSFDQASWVEPVNTCLKGTELLNTRPGEVVAVLGQGPIGLVFTMLLRNLGVQVFASDTFESRRRVASRLGASAYDPRGGSLESALRSATAGRGADCVILATNAPDLLQQALQISRPGAKILLFAQTSSKERIEFSGSDVCVNERVLLGSYSADIDLQAESAKLVFSGRLPLEELISDRFPLSEIKTGMAIAQRPRENSLKVVIHPQERH